MAKLTKIADSGAKITDYGSIQMSALTPFETEYREFTLSNGEKYTWASDRAFDLPQTQPQKLTLMAWGTKDNTLRRVFISWMDKKGMMHTCGMRSADVALVMELMS